MTTISWFAIRVRPTHRLEFQVLHALTQREHPAMVPFEEKSIRQRGKWIKRKFPLFPCYVFAGFMSEHEFYRTRSIINRTAEDTGKAPPILNLVGFGNVPARLTETDVDLIKGFSVERPTMVNLHKAIRPGSQINILEGPFAGHQAKVDAVTKKGVKAMLRLFNSMQLVEISAAALEAA